MLEQRLGGLVDGAPVARCRIVSRLLDRLADDPLDLAVDQLERRRADRAELLQRGAEEDLAALLADRDRAERVATCRTT